MSGIGQGQLVLSLLIFSLEHIIMEGTKTVLGRRERVNGYGDDRD